MMKRRHADGASAARYRGIIYGMIYRMAGYARIG